MKLIVILLCVLNALRQQVLKSVSNKTPAEEHTKL